MQHYFSEDADVTWTIRNTLSWKDNPNDIKVRGSGRDNAHRSWVRSPPESRAPFSATCGVLRRSCFQPGACPLAHGTNPLRYAPFDMIVL